LSGITFAFLDRAKYFVILFLSFLNNLRRDRIAHLHHSKVAISDGITERTESNTAFFCFARREFTSKAAAKQAL
jgi:hypothetical protein